VTFCDSDFPIRRNDLGGEVPVRDAAEFAIVRLGMELDPKQEEILRAEPRRAILNCSRQWGKSTMAAVKAVYRAQTRTESLVLVASPSERQSRLLVRKAARMLAAAGIAAKGDGGADVTLLLANGSRIVGLPATEDTVRGFSSASLLLIDEAARMSDAMYQALRPMLAVGDGDLWLMSTPAGKTGFFYETWMYGEDWLRVSVPVTECTRILPRFIEEERATLGPVVFEREYMCSFTDTGSEVFGRDMVEKALVDEDGWEFL
jgi:Helicase